MLIKEFIKDYAENTYTFDEEQEDYLIANLIFKYIDGKKILDLGCGPVHHILALFFRDFESSTAIDLHQENLDFISLCIKNNILLPSQHSAIKYKNKFLVKEPAHLLPEIQIKNTYQRIESLIKANVLDRREDLVSKFDNVLQVGCFGALDTISEYSTAVLNAANYLKPSGKLLMINWLQNEYTYRPFKFNGKVSSILNKSNYCKAILDAGLNIIKVDQNNQISLETLNMGYTHIIYSVSSKPL